MNHLSPLQRAAEEKLRPLAAQIEQAAPGLDLDLPPGLFQASEKYGDIPELIKKNNAVLEQLSPALAAVYNRYLLLRCIARFRADGGRYVLPPSIVELYPRDFERILRQIDSFENEAFSLTDDRYLKDLAIVSHRLIPVGAEYAEGGQGIPRRLLFSAGLGQFLRGLWLIYFRCGGARPFFALHAHVLALEDFHLEGWEATYRRLADLLAANPRMKGWLSASWFLDPRLEDISPRLAHLRRVPTENGGALLYVCDDPEGKSGALSRSPTRRRLFKEGKYRPAIYMRVWPRRAAIAWSRRRSAPPGKTGARHPG